MKKLFNPEFINRIDETIVFRALDRNDIGNIVDIMIERLNKRLAERHITVALSDNAKSFLVSHGYDSQYGARPMRRTIQRYVEDPMSQLLLEGGIPEGEIIADLAPDNERLVFTPALKLEPAAGTVQ